MPKMKQGDRVGEYVLDRYLGGGGFGEVWRACHHEWSDQVVAVKVPTDPQSVETLRRDGWGIHKIDSPHVVKAFGMDVSADPPYLVTEYVDGRNLRTILQSDAPLGVKHACEVMDQILSALSAAHAAGVVHRDLKPENVLVSNDNVVKLTDFGLSYAAELPTTSIALSGQFAQGSGGISGTLEYMAPEQREGKDVDARADIYACGILLFEMLTGERPSGADTPSTANPEVPRWCDAVFSRSYCRLANRYPDAGAMAKDFHRQRDRIVVNVNEPMPVEPADDSPPKPPKLDLTTLQRRRLCPDCGQPNDAENQFCTRCGRQITEQLRRCAKCGAWPAPDDKFCIFCGKSLGIRNA